VRKEQKEQVVTELVERLKASDTLIVADYRGLSMPEIDDVRTELISHGAKFSVVKNTLTKRAADEAGMSELNALLEGPTAIAFVNEGDMVAVAKTLNETARRTRVLELKGGILQGKPMSAEQVKDLAALPPVETLRGEVLGAIVAPLNAIAGLVNAPLQNLVGLIDARIDQLREQGDTSEAGAEAAPPEERAEEPATEAEETTAEPAAAEPEAAATEEPTAQESTEDEPGAEAESEAEASAETEETKEEEE
jgi:large subunit ribosomal protein L10